MANSPESSVESRDEPTTVGQKSESGGSDIQKAYGSSTDLFVKLIQQVTYINQYCVFRPGYGETQVKPILQQHQHQKLNFGFCNKICALWYRKK